MVCCVALSGSTATPGQFRKPATGMWTWLQRVASAAAATGGCDDGLQFDTDLSFFVGDAAGRQGDHSAVDSQFAAGVGIRFYTETEFFGRGTSGGQLLLPAELKL